jgi:1-acyl-sn-glycerol-3-phosphate acyltransferase
VFEVGRQLVHIAAKLLRILLTGSAFLFFWTGGAILCWVVVPVISLVYRSDPVLARRRCRQIVSLSFRLHVNYMRLCWLVGFDPRSIEAQLPKQPFVLVANHPTLIDVVILLSSYPSICCVAKGQYFRSPLVGSLLRACGHIDAGEGGPFDGAAVIEGAVQRLQAGDPVLIFPEGTRSPMGTVGRFHPGAFRIATQAGVPLIPVSIRVHPPGLMKGMSWYTVPDGRMNFEVSVLSPLALPASEGGAKSHAKATRALLEARVCQ